MSYASQNDLITRFGVEELTELTDRSGAGLPDATVVTAALADADALIDGWIAGRYAVPVSPTPELLRRLAADIARFFLHGKAATDSVRAAYDDAVRILEAIARGTAALAGAAPPGSGAGGGRIAAHMPPRALAPERLADYLG